MRLIIQLVQAQVWAMKAAALLANNCHYLKECLKRAAISVLMIAIIINQRIMQFMVDYINRVQGYLKKHFDLHIDIITYNSPQTKIGQRYTILIFVQQFNIGMATKGQKLFLLNTEQMTVPMYYRKTVEIIQKYGLHVIDYSLENIYHLQKEFPETVYIHMPFPFTLSPPMVKGGQVISLLNSKYRRDVAKGIDKMLSIKTADFTGRWGTTRDEMIRNSKILLNVHYDKSYQIFETIRCYHALELGTLVVSETSLHSNLILFKNLIIFSDNLPIALKTVLQRYSEYQQQVFSENNCLAVSEELRRVYREALERLLDAPINYF